MKNNTEVSHLAVMQEEKKFKSANSASLNQKQKLVIIIV